MKDELGALIDDLAHLHGLSLYRYSQAFSDTIPEFHKMANCPQDPIWHAEGDVLTHTQMVVDAARAEVEAEPGLPQSMRQAIYLAALLHDVGKPATTYTAKDGRIISPGHSRAGLPLARAILYRLGVPFEVREHAIMLIFHHMTAYRLVSRIPEGLIINGINVERKKYWRLATEVSMQALYHLTRADWIGRKGAKIDRVLAQAETFRERSMLYGIWNRMFEGVVDASDLYSFAASEKERSRIKHELLSLSLAGRIQTREEALNYIKEHPDLARQNSAHLYITIGVPGSGKSTWLAENLPGARIVSSDAKREQLFGDVNWQGDNPRVFNECYSDIERALLRGETVVLDATNTRLSQRSGFLNLARRHHAHTTIVYFDLPLEIAIERNQQRARRVPDAAIVRYFQDLIVPRRSEAQELIAITPPAAPPWQ